MSPRSIQRPFVFQFSGLKLTTGRNCPRIFGARAETCAVPREEQTKDLCWKHPLAALTSDPISGMGDARVLSGILTAAMVALYWFFA